MRGHSAAWLLQSEKCGDDSSLLQNVGYRTEQILNLPTMGNISDTCRISIILCIIYVILHRILDTD